MTQPTLRLGVEGVSVEGRLRDIHLELPAGTVTAVVGGDGAGKSTLLGLLAGSLAPDRGTVHAPADRHDIGYVPTSAGFYADLTVDENVAFAAGAYGLGGPDLATRRERVLELTGLSGVGDRLARDLSGGMRRKLALAVGTLHDPDLLILDEPTTGVDPVSRADLWRIVATSAASGASVLVATSYLDEAERASLVLALHEGRALLRGPPAELAGGTPGRLVDTASPTNRALAWRRGARWRQWVPGGGDDGNVSGDPVTGPTLEDAVIVATLREAGPATTAATNPFAGHAVTAPGRAAGGQAAEPATQLELRAVTRRFGALTANADVGFAVRAGEVVGLIGANGAGKTTAIRQALGLLAPSAGSVEQFGLPPSRRTRRRIGYVPQGLGLWADLGVEANLEFVARAYGATVPDGLPGELAPDSDRAVGSLSLGLQRRVAFAAALEHDPELLVLDEPTSGVDALSRSRLWDVIRSRAEEGAGVLVSTHFMDEARQCDRLVVLDAGRVVLRGTHDDIVGDRRAVTVDSDDWAGAFAALDAAGFGCGLVGTSVRVVDADEEAVAATVEAAGVDAQVTTVPATLEETMVAVARGRRAG